MKKTKIENKMVIRKKSAHILICIASQMLGVFLCLMMSNQAFAAADPSDDVALQKEFENWKKENKLKEADTCKENENPTQADLIKRTKKKVKPSKNKPREIAYSLAKGGAIGGGASAAGAVISILGGMMIGSPLIVLGALITLPILTGIGAIVGVIFITVTSDNFKWAHLFTRALFCVLLSSLLGMVGGVLGVFVIGPNLATSKSNPIMDLLIIITSAFVTSSLGALSGVVLTGFSAPYLEEILE